MLTSCKRQLTKHPLCRHVQPLSTFARRYRASKDLGFSAAIQSLNDRIASTLSQTQSRSFSHLYRRNKQSHHAAPNTARPTSIQHSPQPLPALSLNVHHLIAHRRSYSASYRNHHVALLSHISRFLFPALLPPREPSIAYRTKSVPEILASRHFSHTYRQRQLVHLKACLPASSFLRGGRRFASSVPPLHADATKRGYLGWVVRSLAAGATALLALQFVSEQEDNLGPLSDTVYAPWTITAIERVSPTTSLFTLAAKSGASFASTMAPIVSVSVREPNANIQRPYTVISATGTTIQLLVKRYENGDVSRYIHARPIHSDLSLRLAAPTFTPSPTDRAYVAIVAGTGIAPIMQLIQYFSATSSSSFVATTTAEAAGDEEARPEVRVLYASRSDDEIYLKSQLDALVAQWRGKLKVEYFTDSSKHVIRADSIKAAYDDLSEPATTLVCGPEGFVEYIAGHKPEIGQGSVGGLLKQLGVTHDLWKL